jgi:aspartyl-tRNA(Asn)/glutamyl-tRNA(Gln) amidotransferase subunit B
MRPRPKALANWIMGNCWHFLTQREWISPKVPISADHLGQLVKLIDDNTISGKIAKKVFEEMAATGKAPETIVEEKGLVQITDTDAIGEAVDAVIAANPKQADEYKGGKTKVLGFFVGQVMKATRGKANPQMVNELLKSKLDN